MIGEGCNILVATQEKLLEFVEQGKISFEMVQYLGLGWSRQNVGYGFHILCEEDIEENKPSMQSKNNRLILMFSATFTEYIRKLGKEFLNNFIFLGVSVVGGVCEEVIRYFEEVIGEDKKIAQ